MKTGTMPGRVAAAHRAREATPFSSIRLLARMAMLVAIMAMAWWFGGVQAVHQRWLFAGLLAALLLYLGGCFVDRSGSAPLPTAMLPLSLALVLGLLQLVPLPAAVLGRMASRNVSLWQSLCPDGSGSGAAAEGKRSERKFEQELGVPPAPVRRTLSLYPASTRRDLCLLFAAVATFFLASRLFSRSQALIGFFAVVATNGAVLAFFGLAQQLRWDGLLFGTVPLTEGGMPFASFVNRNNGAGYLNMCLGAAIGFTVWAFSQNRTHLASAATNSPARSHGGARERRRLASRRPRGETPPRTRLPLSDGQGHSLATAGGASLQSDSFGSAFRSVQGFFADLTTLKLFALATTACVFAGIVCSLSRGAWLAAAGAAVVTLLLASLVRQAWSRVGLLAVVVVAGLALVGWVGRMELVEQRLATFWLPSAQADSRWAHWENGLAAAADFPLLGSGLGTYRYIYKRYEQNGSDSWFYHAENQYLEALVEVGGLGLLLMLSTIGLAAAACWRLLRQPNKPVGYACGVAGLFALATQVIHAGFDFGLYLPSNMALLAAICGGTCGVAACSASPRRKGRSTRVSPSGPLYNGWYSLPKLHSLPVCLATLLAVAVGFGVLETDRSARVEAAMRSIRLPDAPEAVSVEKIDAAVEQLSRALVNRPDDAEAQLKAAQLWIHRYRLEALAELSRQHPATGDAKPLWALTSTVHLHRRADELERGEHHLDLVRLRRARDVRTNLTNAAEALLAARRACPLLVKPHLLLAGIGKVVSQWSDDAPHLVRAVALATGDYQLLLECGLLEAQAGRTRRACQAWRRALEIAPHQYQQVLTLANQHFDVERHIAELLPESPQLMIRVAREQFADQAPVRTSLARQAAQLLAARSDLPDDQRHYLQGVVFVLQQKRDAAIEQYKRALQLRPEQTEWRFELAQVLDSTGRWEQAERQAALCALMDPDNEQYIAFQRTLVRKRMKIESPLDRQNRTTEKDTSRNLREGDEFSLVEMGP